MLVFPKNAEKNAGIIDLATIKWQLLDVLL